MVEQIADAADADIGRPVGRQFLRVTGVMTLFRENRRHPVFPLPFDRVEDPQLVVDHDVMAGRIHPLDVGQRLFLVDIDQHMAAEGLPQSRAFDLARLKHRVAVGQDHRPAPSAGPFHHVEGVRIQPLREWIVDHPVRHPQQPRIVQVLEPIALQRAQIIGIARAWRAAPQKSRGSARGPGGCRRARDDSTGRSAHDHC